MNPENEQADRAGGAWFATFLLGLGGAISLLITIDLIAFLPFSMPRSWYTDPGLWIALALAALVAGIFLQRPRRGDEYDTS